VGNAAWAQKPEGWSYLVEKKVWRYLWPVGYITLLYTSVTDRRTDRRTPADS